MILVTGDSEVSEVQMEAYASKCPEGEGIKWLEKAFPHCTREKIRVQGAASATQHRGCMDLHPLSQTLGLCALSCERGVCEIRHSSGQLMSG